MRRIDIKPMIQRERRGVIIQSCISARVVNGYRRMRQTSHELLDPADTLRPRDRRPISRVVPEGYVHCVIEAFPLLPGEKGAERRIADSDSLQTLQVSPSLTDMH